MFPLKGNAPKATVQLYSISALNLKKGKYELIKLSSAFDSVSNRLRGMTPSGADEGSVVIAACLLPFNTTAALAVVAAPTVLNGTSSVAKRAADFLQKNNL